MSYNNLQIKIEFINQAGKANSIKEMKLSIIIVSWNVREDLLRCMRSIDENKPSCTFEIIIVDNASTDDTANMIKKSFSEVKLITNHQNRGFAAANNQAIEQSQGEYVLLLNPDTILHPKSLDILVRFMDNNKDVGACGPKLLNDDGTTQRSVRHFPDFCSALYRNTIFRTLRLFHKQYHRYRMLDFSYDRQMEVDILMGAALMTRRSIINEIGAMDESFFMYYEEADLCYRIKQAGWHITFIPTAVITHLGGQSSGQIPVRTRIRMLKSLLIFFRKHRGKFSTGIFNCIFKPAVILRDICNIASASVVYILATVVLNKRQREKSAVKIKNSAILLSKYSWQLLFKI